MTKELVIRSTGTEIEIALLEDGRLVELNREKTKSGFTVGDIYLGKVHKVMGGLNAAFVDVGYQKDAFLHYLDLGTAFSTLNEIVKQANGKHQKVDISTLRIQQGIGKEGRIGNVLSNGQHIIVQIAKEPISTKGPRVTSDISIAGRHSVLIPLSNKVHISQKIRSNEERKRLKSIVEGVLPKNYGAIVRTAAEGKTAEDIEADILSLISKWEAALSTLRNAQAPTLLLSEESRTTTILRDLLNDSFTHIYTDNDQIYHEVKDYISTIEPDAEKIVKMYKGNVPIFDQYDVTKQIKQLFGRTVVFKRGAYLVVEHTEALHVIDVNSGKRAKSDESQENNALEVNLNAVPEIARQLRLKDMGGIIVIDFIDLHSAQNRTKLFNAMREAMAGDRAKHNILPLSKFGLMQITRQRVRPETHIEIKEKCPTCHGTGEIAPSVLLDAQIENQIAYYVREKHYKYLNIHVHPYLAAYLKRGFIGRKWKWLLKYRAMIKIIPNDSMGLIEYKFYNTLGDAI